MTTTEIGKVFHAKNSKNSDGIYQILRGMIREEINQTPGFRELTAPSEWPASVDAEKVVLGAVMLDNDLLSQLNSLAPDDFSLDSHQRIIMHMRNLSAASRSVDIITLADSFGQGGIREIGGVAYLASLTEGLPLHPAVEEYILIIKEKSNLRRIMRACAEAIEVAKMQQASADEIVAGLGIALKGIRAKPTNKN